MDIREKKHRLVREAYQGKLEVCFTACVKHKVPELCHESVFKALRSRLYKSCIVKDCTIPMYCFLPDHLHVVIKGSREESDVYAAMVAFKVSSGIWFKNNWPSLEWQKDFYDHIIRDADDARSQVRHIADNPCRLGLVDRWQDWPRMGSFGHRIEDWLY